MPLRKVTPSTRVIFSGSALSTAARKVAGSAALPRMPAPLARRKLRRDRDTLCIDALRSLQRHCVLFDVLVHFRLRHLSLIDVIEALGEGNVVSFCILTLVVEQELANVLAVGSLVVVA